MQFSTLQNDFSVSFNEKQGTIIQKWLEQLTAYKKMNVAQLEAELNENNLDTFQNFIANKNFATLQDIGLLLL
jgi:nucleoid-associated protein YejK